MQWLDQGAVKHSFTTRVIPEGLMAAVTPFRNRPRIGDIVAAEVVSLGRHATIESRQGVTTSIFPGDQIIGAFGNRYATDHFEGYVPAEPVDECDLLAAGGVIGAVASQHGAIAAPTRLRLLGAVCGNDGQQLNQRQFGLPSRHDEGHGEIILVVGASMNSGKTTTAGSAARALSRSGYRVAAAKVTGTAAGKDARFFASCGARPVFDFTDAGYPSTYMLDLHELMSIYQTLLAHMRISHPDYMIVEIADGIFQRETRMMLGHAPFRASIDHVMFSAIDSLSAECGARYLRELDLPLRAMSGTVTQSPLSTREAEEATMVPCLSVDRMMDGEMLNVLGASKAPPAEMARERQQVA